MIEDPARSVRDHFAHEHPPARLVDELLAESADKRQEARFTWLLPLLVVGAALLATVAYASM